MHIVSYTYMIICSVSGNNTGARRKYLGSSVGHFPLGRSLIL